MAYNLSGYKIIQGTSGDDTLTGGQNNTAIYGNGGADTINGGGGADLLTGGSGATFVFSVDGSWSAGYGAQNAGDPSGAGPGTTFSLAGYGRSFDVFVGVGTNNTVVMPDGKNALFLDDGLSPGVDATRLHNIQTIQAGNGGQIIDLTSSRVGYGNVTLLGGTGDDVLMSSSGNDSVSGGAGKDYLWGGSGNDTLMGGAGVDTLLGATGDDLLDGGTEADVMTGGAGNDTYVVDVVGDAVNELAAGGIDTVRSAIAYTLGANLENLALTGTAAINGTGNALDNVINGNSAANVIDGMAGNDKVFGGAGNDTVRGGDGNDQVHGDEGNDLLEGGAGNDTLNGGAHNDTMLGGTGNDGFFGGGGLDLIFGEDGNDKLYGDGGNDTLSGGRGDDVLAGGQIAGGYSLGNDTFAWARSDVINADGSRAGYDRIVDFGAGDRLDFSAVFAGQPVRPPSSEVRFTDTAAGTVVGVSVDGGQSFVDAVIIEGQNGLDVDQMIASGALVV
jgi:Ca2+-binding RTX toxin-like protein